MTFVSVFLAAPEGLEEERRKCQDVVGAVNEAEGLKLGVLFVRFSFPGKLHEQGVIDSNIRSCTYSIPGCGRLPGIQGRGFEYDLKTHPAIATADGVSVCDHLARCTGAVIFQIENGSITSRLTRFRNADGCGNHLTFTELFSGCPVAICGGIGQGAATALAVRGIEPIVLAAPMPIDSAVTGDLAGSLATTTERSCLCG
ncbi:MAG TPA: NifB/NifX family molybdenum-iron cluster-binding protein [Bryobacteraceae bacterium]|nr:NifB/NifX family molybdenum-iron cluster-binding protein [Bryobacteraceae bacterium]